MNQHRRPLGVLLFLLLMTVALTISFSASAAELGGEGDQLSKLLKYQASQASSSAQRARRTLQVPSASSSRLRSQAKKAVNNWNSALQKSWDSASASSKSTQQNMRKAAKDTKDSVKVVSSAKKSKDYTADVRVPVPEVEELLGTNSVYRGQHLIYFIQPLNHITDDGGADITMTVFQLRVTRKGNLIILLLIRNNNGHSVIVNGLNQVMLADNSGVFAGGYPDAFKKPISMDPNSLLLLRLDFYPGTWMRNEKNPTRDEIRVYYSFNYGKNPAALPAAGTKKKQY